MRRLVLSAQFTIVGVHLALVTIPRDNYTCVPDGKQEGVRQIGRRAGFRLQFLRECRFAPLFKQPGPCGYALTTRRRC